MRTPGAYYGFIGQRRVVRFVNRLVEGAKRLGEACPPKILGGGSGLGKTRLALAIAGHFETKLHHLLGKSDINAVALAVSAETWEACDVVFIDEAHALTAKVQELLYRVIDMGRAPQLEADEKMGKRVVKGEVEIPPVTIVLATDQPGRLLDALRKRCNELMLRPYTERELTHITLQRARELGIQILQRGRCSPVRWTR